MASSGPRVCRFGPQLAGLTREAKLPPAVYLLIDVIDNEHRSREPPCNADFGWRWEELLPGYSKSRLLATAPIVPWSPVRVLAAWRRCLLRFYWLQRLAALSQSGFYWWPHRGGAQTGLLIERLS